MPPPPPFDSTITPVDYSAQTLTARHGAETVNYFGSSPLNRLSFLRSSVEFLTVAQPAGQYILFSKLRALVTPQKTLARIHHDAVRHLLAAPKEEVEMVREFVGGGVPEKPVLVFLGLDPTGSEGAIAFRGYSGVPVFALDVSGREADYEGVIGERGWAWDESRINTALAAHEAGVLAQARQLLHWHARNRYCSQCGGRTLSVQCGSKRICPPNEERGCEVREGVHNVAVKQFPRTDPTVIMAIVNSAGTHVLLGHNRRFPSTFFSCLAGFVEPGESAEDAVRRESWEEAGVKVGRVVLHSTQPWPYPACLMLGAVGQALPGEGEKIDLGHDPELDKAEWVELGKVKEALDRARQREEGKVVPEGEEEGTLMLPGSTAIAYQLLLAVTKGWHRANL